MSLEKDNYQTDIRFVRDFELWMNQRSWFGRHPVMVADPFAGIGNILTVFRPRCVVAGHELRSSTVIRDSVGVSTERAGFLDSCVVFNYDYIKNPSAYVPSSSYTGGAVWVVTNPPYSVMQCAMTSCLSKNQNVAALLPVDFMTTMKRASWLSRPGNRPAWVVNITRRPSFSGNGKTDNKNYAWFVWYGSRVTHPSVDWILYDTKKSKSRG